MSKKLVGAICTCLFVVSAGVCAIGYAVGNSNIPWWLCIFAAGIICAILSQIGDITREKKKDTKHKKLIGCICSSISMLSVFVYLTLIMTIKFYNGWIIIVAAGIISYIIYTIDKAVQSDKKNKK